MDHGVARGLSEILAEGIRVFRERDGVDLSDTHIRERAANLAMAILGNYDVRLLDDDEPSAFDSIGAVTAHS